MSAAPEPACRSCYLARLTPDERARVTGEALTMPAHLCDRHAADMRRLDSLCSPIRHAVEPRRFTEPGRGFPRYRP